jgi:hypothetical protein
MLSRIVRRQPAHLTMRLGRGRGPRHENEPKVSTMAVDCSEYGL